MNGDSRIKVLLAIPSLALGGTNLEQGGPEGVIATLFEHLDRCRFDVDLVVNRRDDESLLSELEQDATALADSRRRRTIGPLERYPVPGLLRVVRARRPDVVLSTQRMNPTCALAKPFFPQGTRLLCRVANNVTGTLDTQRESRSAVRYAAAGRLHRLVLRRADGIIAQSTAMERDLTELAPQHADRIHTIPNPVDVEGLLRRAELPAEPPPRPGRPQLVSVGRLHRQKGYDLLLPAFAQTLHQWPEARLRILGEGPDREALQTQATGLGIADRVDLVGFVREPAPHLASADLYVCSSRYEGFSNALAEALAVGVPAVAPDGAAAGQDLVDEVSGVLIQSTTVHHLAVGMSEALRRSDFDRNAISRNCEARFSRDSIVDQYAEVITGLLGGRASSRPVG
jgi:glycosyltransferase involved in cell wall biosynthesis